MIKSFLICCSVLFIWSCKPSIPKDVLSPSEMKKVLWDVMLADEMSEYYKSSDSSFATLAKHTGYYQSIFAAHKTNEASFKRSLKFYMEHPAIFKPVLDSMQSYGDRLQSMQTNLDTPIKATKPRPDSIKKKLLMNKPSI